MTDDKRNDRGADLHRTYLATGDLTLLDQAVELFRSAVAEAPADDPRRAAYLSNLAVGLSDRYERTGSERDLDEAIETGWKAVRSTPSDSPDRITYLGNLGVFLSDRYDRSGDLHDLDTALDLLTESLEHAEPGSSDTARAYSNLSMLLIDSYERTRRSDALDAAIQAAEAALENTPKGDEEFPGHLINLGNARRMRYEHLAVQDLATDGEPAIEITDLLLAIAAYERAAELSTGSQLRPKVLTNLGNVLLDRSAVLNSEDDYARAITCLREAVEVTSPSSTDLVGRLNNLATALRFGPGESAEAVRLYRRCCETDWRTNAEDILAAAQNWGQWALERRAWSEASEAFSAAWRAADHLYRLQVGRQNKQTWLHSFTELGVGGALAASMLGDGVGAVLALERGRALMLAEALERDRADLEALLTIRPELARRYLHIVGRLRGLDASS